MLKNMTLENNRHYKYLVEMIEKWNITQEMNKKKQYYYLDMVKDKIYV